MRGLDMLPGNRFGVGCVWTRLAEISLGDAGIWQSMCGIASRFYIL